MDFNVFESKLDEIVKRKTDELIKIILDKEERKVVQDGDTVDTSDEKEKKPKRTRATLKTK
jgi:hypothetical protein